VYSAGRARAHSPSRIAYSPRTFAQINLDVPLKLAKDRVMADFEKKYVAALLEWAGGNVTRAARRAGMDRINMHRIIQKRGLRAPRSMDS
jgi:DNA-binding NtrC family response regulator